MRRAIFAVVQARPYLGVDDVEFCVLLALANELRETTGLCFPSPELIAYHCGQASSWEATARRVIDRLEDKQLIAVERPGPGPRPGGRGHHKRYHLHPKLTPGLKVAAPARFDDWWAPWPPERNLAAPARYKATLNLAATQANRGPNRTKNMAAAATEPIDQDLNQSLPPPSSRRVGPSGATVGTQADLVEDLFERIQAVDPEAIQDGKRVLLDSGKVLEGVADMTAFLRDHPIAS